jgi:hypothetical protein
MKLIKADNNAVPLRWKYTEAETPYPPAVVEIRGKTYIISGFDKLVENFLSSGETDLNGALELSISIHGEPNSVELGHMIRLAENFGKGYHELPVLSTRVKGRKNAEALKVLSTSPAEFRAYIDDKQPSLKTIGMYASLPETHKQFLHAYISKAPSVSMFRTAVELLTDYANEAIDPDDMSLIEKLESKRSAVRAGFSESFKKLSSSLGVDISSRNNFETAELTVTFNVSNPDEYIKKCEELSKNSKNIVKVYDFLKENDIY